MSSPTATTLSDLRRSAERDGAIDESLTAVLRMVGLPHARYGNDTRLNQALAAAGLVSVPPVSGALPADASLTLTVATTRSERSTSSPTELAIGPVLQRFETDNPFLLKLFAHELFGVVTNDSGELFRNLETVVPQERLISALMVRHGLTEGGVLMVTTHWLRYVKHGRLFTVTTNDDFWPLDGGLELQTSMGDRPLFISSDGNQFQVFPAVPVVSRRQARAFFGIYRLAALAISHFNVSQNEAARDNTTRSEMQGSALAISDLKELVAMRNAGDLNATEFQAAKARLLGL